MLPRQDKTKGVHHHQAIITWKFKGIYLRKRRIKLWILKWQQAHNYKKLNLKQRKQLEQEQNQRYVDYLEGYQLGEVKGENGGKGAGITKYKLVGREYTGGG